jgi:hypothetical protein
VQLIASLLGQPTVPPPVVRTWINSTGNPLVRFTGSVHDWTTAITPAAGDVGKVIEDLSLTIQTGGDDLRGGSGPNDNASVILTLKTGPFTIGNINKGAHWNNNETHTVPLNLPAGTKVGDISKFDLHTQFGGGLGGDNWNVNQIVLQVTIPG